jgi:hypothetical protein
MAEYRELKKKKKKELKVGTIVRPHWDIEKKGSGICTPPLGRGERVCCSIGAVK